MVWFWLAILSAIFQSFKEISIKNNLRELHSNSLIFLLSWLSVVFWLPFVLYIWVPELSLKFWLVFFVSWTLFYIWKIFSFKAIQIEDVSYLAPFKWLLTIWVVILSIFILDEYPSFLWLLWIVLIIIWTYLLNINSSNKKLIDPFLHIIKNKLLIWLLVVLWVILLILW